jgi:hypothetical protein
MTFDVEEFKRILYRNGNIDRTSFHVRKMTEDDNYLVDLEVVWHGKNKFDIIDLCIQCQQSVCRFML